MWWNDYIGIPFKWHGTDKNGCSCWGLVCLIADEVFGKKLPRHDEIESGAENGIGSPKPYFAEGHEIDLKDAKEGDILHMNSFYKGKMLPLHVGIIVASGKVLHVKEGKTSFIEDYTKQPLKHLVIGAYRLA